MRVVIVGAGKLGYTIAELLSVEQMEVIVIDREENQLIAVKNNLDVLTIVANGSSPSTLSDPDVNSADIFIAVTGIDEVNLVACILAKEQGIPHTVARVRDMQLINDSKNYLKKNFSIDLALNPEMIAAQEIYRILMTPAALNVDDFANGKIRLFEVKIDRRSKISNIPLKKIKLPSEILVGLIFRNHQMIIPHGDDLLKLHDSAYLIGFPEAIEKFSSNFIFQDSKKIERVMIIGAGRVTKSLVTMLLQNRINIKIIDKDRARCEYIAQILSGNNIAIQGDGTDIDLLIEEGIASTDVVVCLTEDDKLNLMIALLAKHLGAKKTVVRIYRTEYADLIENIGIDVIISVRLLAASKVLSFVRRGGIVNVSILEGARAEALELIVQSGARVAGKKLMEVKLPKTCLVCAYVRNDQAAIPNGNTILKPGDRTILFCLRGAAQEILTWFN